MLGKQIAHYHIEKLLGEGGMGNVYLAKDEKNDRWVAVKSLRGNTATEPQVRQRFRQEASTMAQLHHKNLVQLYDFIADEKGIYLIMEYVEGENLEHFIARNLAKLSPLSIVEMFLQVLDAVSYAHRQGIVHRDIKPSNVMLAKDGTLKVFDFGIAKLADETSPSLTRTGAKIGTVLYMSPEQVKGLPVDSRSDIYSLGVTLFQMLTGKSPYDTIGHNEFDISLRIVTEPLPPPQNPFFELPAILHEIILKATEKSPDKRYASCYEFAEALHSCAQEIALKEAQTDSLHLSPQELMAETFAIPEPPKKKWLPYLVWGTVLFFVLLALGFKNAGYLQNIFFVKKHSQTELKARIYDYYKNVETHDFAKVKPFYARHVEKYFGKTGQNISDLQNMSENYWKKTPKEDHVIAWETFTVQEEANGHYTVRFSMTYHYQRTDKPWQEQRAKTQISLDNKLRIYAIVGIK